MRIRKNISLSKNLRWTGLMEILEDDLFILNEGVMGTLEAHVRTKVVILADNCDLRNDKEHLCFCITNSDPVSAIYVINKLLLFTEEVFGDICDEGIIVSIKVKNLMYP